MSFVQTPDQYPNERRAAWPDAPTQPADPVYNAPGPAYNAPDEEAREEARIERRAARRSWNIGRAGQIIYIALGALDALLLIRFALKLLAANPFAGFTSFIYGVTELFVAPFEGVFPSPQTRGSVLEVSTLLAIIVYALLAWLVVSVIEALISRWPSRSI